MSKPIMDIKLDGLFLKNESYDYDYNYEYKEAEPKGEKAVWILLLYSVLVIVGLLGNGLLLAVLAQKRQSWSVSDSYILQLGVVDILLLVTLPFYTAHAYQSCGWCSQTFLSICGAVFKINLYVGVFMLVCICLDHYLSSTYSGQRSCHRASLAFGGWMLVWLISIVLTVLDWSFIQLVEDSMPGKALSAHSHPESGLDWQLISRGLHLGVGFLLPAIVLTMCCSHIIIRCRSNVKQSKRPVVLILCLVAVFLLCWFPYNIALVIDTICYTSEDFLKRFFADHISSLKAAVNVTSAVGCSSASIRPLLYFFLCGSFRRGIFSLFKCAQVESKNSLWELGVGKEAPHDQCQSEDEMKQMTSTQQQIDEPV